MVIRVLFFCFQAIPKGKKIFILGSVHARLHKQAIYIYAIMKIVFFPRYSGSILMKLTFKPSVEELNLSSDLMVKFFNSS